MMPARPATESPTYGDCDRHHETFAGALVMDSCAGPRQAVEL